jgi:hypothetical protein
MRHQRFSLPMLFTLFLGSFNLDDATAHQSSRTECNELPNHNHQAGCEQCFTVVEAVEPFSEQNFLDECMEDQRGESI